jgi:hypothetical protein
VCGSVEIVEVEESKGEKQVPHPAKNAGIRDDTFGVQGLEDRIRVEFQKPKRKRDSSLRGLRSE